MSLWIDARKSNARPMIAWMALIACFQVYASSEYNNEINFTVRTEVGAESQGIFTSCIAIMEGAQVGSSNDDGFSFGLGVGLSRDGIYNVQLYHRVFLISNPVWQPNTNHSVVRWIKIGSAAPLSIVPTNLMSVWSNGYSSWSAEDINGIALESLAGIKSDVPIWINVAESDKEPTTYSGLLNISKNHQSQLSQCLKEINIKK